VKYFFANLYDEYGTVTFVGGSPVLKGAQNAVEKHAFQVYKCGVGPWVGKDPSETHPERIPQMTYRVSSKEVQSHSAL
jgi:hypothetical protein